MQPFEKPDPAHNPKARDLCPLRKLNSPVGFVEEEEKRVLWLFRRYPTKQAAILPILWMIQEKYGWVPEEAIPLVAERCNVPPSHVYGVVSFYTMFNRAPKGRFHLQICTNLSCQLLGAENLLVALRRKLGIDLKQTTSDGLFSLDEVECLAACEMAPVVQVNDQFVGPLNESKLDELLAKLRAEGRRRDDGSAR